MINFVIKITFLFFLVLISACSKNSFCYLKVDPVKVSDSAKYYIKSISVELSTRSKKKVFIDYPDQAKLTDILKEGLMKKLQENNLYSSDSIDINNNFGNNFGLDIKIKYKRIGVIYSKTAYHSFRISHEILVTDKNDEIIAKSVKQNYKAPRNLFSDYISNIKIIFAKKGPESEEEDLDIVLNQIVNELSELRVVQTGCLSN